MHRMGYGLSSSMASKNSLVPTISAGDNPARPFIAVVDERLLSRECLLHFLTASNSAGWTIEAFGSLEESTTSDLGEPEVILAYIRSDMDEEFGAALTLARSPSSARVIIFTDEPPIGLAARAAQAIQAGVKGYFSTVDCAAQTVHSAIELILNGGTFVSSALLVAVDTRVKTRQLPKPADDLTHRQREVLELIKEGKPNKIIADALGLSEATVKIHLRHIFQRLGVTNRTQAAATLFAR